VTNNSIVAFILSVIVSLSFLSCSPYTTGQLTGNSRIVELVSIDLDSRNPERREFRRLTLLNAFELRSRDPRFGGLSGLSIGADGKLYAVSDRGYWIAARMNFDAEHRLIDLTEWNIQPILSTSGSPVAHPLADAEALARAPDGSFLVGFEQRHRIWRYAAPPATFSSLPLPIPVPPELADAPPDGGLESVTVLPDGKILAIAEQFANADGTFKGWLLQDHYFAELSYRPSNGFFATDCTALKNGDVLVLERRYMSLGIFSARLKLVKAKNIQPGARLVGEELLRLQSPLEVDNFEGLTVQEDPITGTTIYIISDDNYNPLERTLLFQFRLSSMEN
jgi:hypothetical protein